MKGTVASVLLSLEVLVLEEANGHAMRMLTPVERFPKQENEGSVPAAVLEVDLPALVESLMSVALLSILTVTSEQTVSQNYPADPIPSSWPKKLR